MKTLLIVGSLVAATAAAPVAAQAAVRCVNPQTNATTGALVGAAGGAAIGAAADRNHAAGALIGGLAGAVVGGAIGHSQTRCPDGYYAYDDQTRQYYDNGGRVYVPPGGYGPPPPAAYGPGPGYGPGYAAPMRGDFWYGAPAGIGERVSFLRDRLQRAASSGRIRPGQANRSYADLDDIMREWTRLRARDGGVLSPPDRQYLQGRLDRARQILNFDVRSNY